MQASVVAAGGNVGSKLQNHRFPSGIAGFRKRVSGVSNLCMVSRGFCSESSPSSVEAKIACSRMGMRTFSQSEAKARSVRAQAYGLCITFTLVLGFSAYDILFFFTVLQLTVLELYW